MSDKKDYSSFAKYAGLGFQLVTPLLLGLAIGIFLDNKFFIKPWLTIIGLCTGVIVTFVNLIKLSM